jgi:hypothetical protein
VPLDRGGERLALALAGTEMNSAAVVCERPRDYGSAAGWAIVRGVMLYHTQSGREVNLPDTDARHLS